MAAAQWGEVTDSGRNSGQVRMVLRSSGYRSWNNTEPVFDQEVSSQHALTGNGPPGDRHPGEGAHHLPLRTQWSRLPARAAGTRAEVDCRFSSSGAVPFWHNAIALLLITVSGEWNCERTDSHFPVGYRSPITCLPPAHRTNAAHPAGGELLSSRSPTLRHRRAYTLISLRSVSVPLIAILRGLAFSATGMRRVSTPAS